MKQAGDLPLFALIIMLPLLGGENYLWSLSPIWGKGFLILAGGLVLFFRIFFSGKDDRIFVSPGIDGLILAYVVWVTFSSFFSRSRADSVLVLLGMAGTLFCGLLIRLFLKEARDIEKIINIVLLSSIPVAAYAIFQSFWQFKTIAAGVANDSSLIPFAQHFSIHRTPFSTFLTSNALGCFLVMITPLTFYFILADNGKRKFFGLALFCSLSFVLFLTGSKGAVLTYLLLNGLMLVILRRIQPGKWILFAKPLLLTIAISLLMVLVAWRFEWKPVEQNTLSNEISAFTPTGVRLSSSADARIQYWITALNIWKESPLIGSGIGSFAAISSGYQESAFYAKHVHNDYLEILAETGITGFAFFLGFNLLLWLKGTGIFRFILKSPDFKPTTFDKSNLLLLMISLFLSMAGFLIHSAIDFNWENMANRTLFFILFMSLAALLGMISKVTSGKPSFIQIRVHNGILRISSLFMLVMLGVLVPKTTLAESFFNLAGDPFANNLSKSIEFAVNAEEMVPWDFKYHLFLAGAYRRRGIQTKDLKDLDLALNEANRALSLQPQISQTHAEIGLIYMVKGELDRSEQEWLYAIQREKGNIRLYNNLGKLYIKEHDLIKGRAILEKGLAHEKAYLAASHPDMFDVIEGHLLLAGLTEIAGEKSGSLNEYKNVLNLLKAYPGLDSVGHWNVIQPEFKATLKKYAEMKVGELTKTF